VWGPAHRQDLDYLRVAIRSLRRKMEQDPSNPRLIVNEPGVGYRIAVNLGLRV
ncbi:winged helix-turn-helix domain-containing protein, partial [Qipengyuania pacifica]|uniref:winged helix-turn-helix domain-containing protein n=1 Tax=Qipengyuania pacifica TaxID=2860199 RepID=UPI0035C7E706